MKININHGVGEKLVPQLIQAMLKFQINTMVHAARRPNWLWYSLYPSFLTIYSKIIIFAFVDLDEGEMIESCDRKHFISKKLVNKSKA
jgi:hypothetical protein